MDAKMKKKPIKLPEKNVIDILKKFSSSRNLPSFLKTRANYVLQAYEGYTYTKIALRTHSSRDTVRVWVNRFNENIANLDEICKVSPDNLESAIYEALSDRPRSGAPCVYDEEIRKSIILLCCCDIKNYKLDADRWSLNLLQNFLVKMGVVDSISIGAIYNILKKAGMKPWKKRYYIKSVGKFDDENKFKEYVKNITYDYLVSSVRSEKIEFNNIPSVDGLNSAKDSQSTQPSD